MILWQVSYDLGLVENQFLWQIPLALAFLFGLTYSILDDVVEWIEEKWEELREFLGCEEEESVFDKVAAALESWADGKVSQWKKALGFSLFVFAIKLIAGLIAVLAVGALSLYVWVGREFHQAGIFLMTLEDLVRIVLGLREFCEKLWLGSFKWLWTSLLDISMFMLIYLIIKQIFLGLRFCFKGKNLLWAFRAIAWILLTSAFVGFLSVYLWEATFWYNLGWTLFYKIKWVYTLGTEWLSIATISRSLILIYENIPTWVGSLLVQAYYWATGLFLVTLYFLRPGLESFIWNFLSSLQMLFIGLFTIILGLSIIVHYLREGRSLNQNCTTYVAALECIITGLFWWIVSVIDILVSWFKK